MARRHTEVVLPADPFDVMMALVLGPTDNEYTDAELAAGWEEYRDELMDGRRSSALPWGFWRYELGIEEPEGPAERVRLLNLPRS
jgi:hypothetical protein